MTNHQQLEFRGFTNKPITRIIGITGFARAGKTTFAKYLQKRMSKQYPTKIHKIYAFANALKEEANAKCQQLHGISAFTENWEEKKLVRPLLVEIGLRERKTDPEHWIKVLDKVIQRDNPDTAIVSDVRFLNEAKWLIKTYEGRLIEIRRKGVGPYNATESTNNFYLTPLVHTTYYAENNTWIKHISYNEDNPCDPRCERCDQRTQGGKFCSKCIAEMMRNDS